MYWLVLTSHESYDEVMRKINEFINNFYLELSSGVVKGGEIKEHIDRVVSATLNVFRRKFLLSKLHGRIYMDLYLSKQHLCAVFGEVEESDFHRIATYISYVLGVKIVDLPLLKILRIFKDHSESIRIITEGKDYSSDNIDPDLLPSMQGFVVGSTVVKKRYAYSPSRTLLKRISEIVINEI